MSDTQNSAQNTRTSAPDLRRITHRDLPAFKTRLEELGDTKMLYILENLILLEPQNPFAYLIGLIIGQKIWFSTARIMRGILYANVGPNGRNFTPEDILAISDKTWETVLRTILPKRKTILEVAHHFIENKPISQLRDIKYVGSWTIECFCIYLYVEHDGPSEYADLFPITDAYVNKKLKELYGVNPSSITSFTTRYAPFKSLAFYCIWKHNLYAHIPV